MQTQITCPACKTPYVAELFEIIDLGVNPELKQMLLGGYLNAAQCPACGATTHVTTPLLYHDPDNELFLVHIPLEMGLAQAEQEKLVGQLVRRAMDRLPPEKRRGYMFQPKTILSMQTLLEEVLKTEGITPEMIENQRKQLELLQRLISVDATTADKLIKERASEIDETFFVIFRSMLESAEANGQEDQLLKLLNLQARLYRDTPYGQRLEKQQNAIHALNRDVKQSGGLSPSLLLKHVLANRSDARIVASLVSVGMSAFNYDFFVQLSEKIEKREKSGINAEELKTLRDQLLQFQQEMERESQEIIARIQKTLRQLLEADDKRAVIRRNLDKIDELFMNVLAATQDQAAQKGDRVQAEALLEIQELIFSEYERQAPPQLRLFNQMLRMEDGDGLSQLVEENQELISPDLLELVRSLGKRAEGEKNKELRERLDRIERVIQAKLLA